MKHKNRLSGNEFPSLSPRPGKGAVCLTVLCVLLLAAAAVWTVWMLFVWSLRERADLPAAGPVSGEMLGAFLDSPFFFAAIGALVLIPAAVLVAANVHRLRRVFGGRAGENLAFAAAGRRLAGISGGHHGGVPGFFHSLRGDSDGRRRGLLFHLRVHPRGEKCSVTFWRL